MITKHTVLPYETTVPVRDLKPGDTFIYAGALFLVVETADGRKGSVSLSSDSIGVVAPLENWTNAKARKVNLQVSEVRG